MKLVSVAEVYTTKFSHNLSCIAMNPIEATTFVFSLLRFHFVSAE